MNDYAWALVTNELASPSSGNLWDVSAALAVAESQCLWELQLTGDQWYAGAIAELQDLLYCTSVVESTATL